MVSGQSSVCRIPRAIADPGSAWLQILAAANKEKPGSDINDVLMMHWKKYGRSFFSRWVNDLSGISDALDTTTKSANRPELKR